MSKLLIAEPPLQILPQLAVRFGLNEAIFIQQLHYWLINTKTVGKFIDNRKWISNSAKQWRNDNFPFWSEDTIQRAIKSLVKQGAILTRNDLNNSAFDRTNWYTIDYSFLDREPQVAVTASPQVALMESSDLPSSYTETTNTETTQPETTKNQPTNQPVVSSLIGASGLVGFDLPEQGQVEEALPAEETTPSNNRLVGSLFPGLGLGFDNQPLQATAAPPLPEHPPTPPGPATVAEYDRSVALLTDDDVGMSKANAARFAEHYSYPWIVAHVADWWEDWQTGAVVGVGALYNRIRAEWAIVGVSDVFLRSDLYARHYPLPPDRLAEWAAWRSSACAMEALLQKGYDEDFALGLVSQHEPPPWLDELPPDVRALLDALPVPTGEAVQP